MLINENLTVKKISLDISLKNAMTSNEQWADFRITSIMRLSLAIYLCAITTSIMDVFSADKSVANITQKASSEAFFVVIENFFAPLFVCVI